MRPPRREVLERVDREEQLVLARGSARRARRSPRRSCRARAGAGSPSREHRDRRRRASRESITRTLSPPSCSAAVLRALRTCRTASTEMCSEKMRSYAARAPRTSARKSPGVGCDVVGSSSARAQPRVELVRRELDVVAEALVAEADVERHDAPVREALAAPRGSRRSSRGRSPCSRRSASSPAARADRVDDLVELLVLRDARDRAGLESASTSRRFADAVRQTTRDVRARPRARPRVACDAVQPGQAVVHQHDVGLVLAHDVGRRRRPSATRRDDLDVARAARAGARAPRGRPRCPRRGRRGSAAATRCSLFGREQQRVVRLAAGRAPRARARGARSRSARAGRRAPARPRRSSSVSTPRGSSSSRSSDRARDLVEARRRPRPARRRRARASRPCGRRRRSARRRATRP